MEAWLFADKVSSTLANERGVDNLIPLLDRHTELLHSYGEAKVLNVGQPTLTTQVKALEARYGVELFHRIGRKVALTEAGKELYKVTLAMA